LVAQSATDINEILAKAMATIGGLTAVVENWNIEYQSVKPKRSGPHMTPD